MYFDTPREVAAVNKGIDVRLVLSVNGLAILALGLFPGMLMSWCIQAMHY